MIRHSPQIVAALCISLLSAAPTLAQYPVRPITLVVPFSAGGGSDSVARIVSEHMAKTLGQPIIIENDGGAGGTTATARVARAPADGYTLILGNLGTHGAAPAQYPNLKYAPAKDFNPIGQTAGHPMVIVTRKDFPADNLQEFVDYVRKNQAKLNEAHSGVGSQSHTVCTLLQAVLGIKTARVAYRGTGPSLNDVIAGQVDFKCVGLNAAWAQIQARTIKVIAVASPKRAVGIADVPTSIEGGVPEFQVSGWNALFAPRGLSPDIRATLSGALRRALDDERVRSRLLGAGGEIPDEEDRTPQALERLVVSEVARWSAVLKAAATRVGD